VVFFVESDGCCTTEVVLFVESDVDDDEKVEFCWLKIILMSGSGPRSRFITRCVHMRRILKIIKINLNQYRSLYF